MAIFYNGCMIHYNDLWVDLIVLQVVSSTVCAVQMIGYWRTLKLEK